MADAFIKKANEKHGDKYIYSKVNYVNSRTKVTITCQSHGDFIQSPAHHIAGTGCPTCSLGSKNKKSQSEIIEECIKVHGETYDYSKSVYINSTTKMIIICKNHGDFEQKLNEHLRGYGCVSCSGTKKKTTSQYIEDAIKKHGDKYDYSLVEYINSTSLITIVCKTHGPFQQVAKEHLRYGCSGCSGNKKKDTPTFIKEAIKIHGNVYDYSKVEYINHNTPVTIICKLHGEFKQSPGHHLDASNCKKCAFNNLSIMKTKTTEQFIEEAIEVHGDEHYDYSEVKYVNSALPVIIICNYHNYAFSQTPQSHLVGSNCPKCSKSYKKTKEEIIEESKKVHGPDKIDYSKMELINMGSPIHLICKVVDKNGTPHGDFMALPVPHLLGRDCKKCSTQKTADKQRFTIEQFTEKANKIHQNKYDYSKSIYVDSKTKIIIICKKHGEFQQSPLKHLSAQGCIKCSHAGYSGASIKWLNYISKLNNITILHAEK